MSNLVDTSRRWIELRTAQGDIPTHVAAVAGGHDHIRIIGPRDDAMELARTIHTLSPRAAGRLDAVNWREDFPESLIHSELFGHLADAFAGAYRSYRGRVWRVDGGTLVLAGTDRLAPGFRRVWNRFTATGDVWPIGATLPVGRVDVRVVEIGREELSMRGFLARTPRS